MAIICSSKEVWFINKGCSLEPRSHLLSSLPQLLSTVTAEKSTNTSRSIFYNLGHNILRIFDGLPNFSFTTSETNRDYYK